MFDTKPKSYTDLLGKTNRIVEGTTIHGEIVSPADFRLDGHLIGNFQSKGKIVIGPAGSVKGDIVCKNADIEGKCEVICGKLSVEPGAEFSATCTMKTNQKLISASGQPTEEKTT